MICAEVTDESTEKVKKMTDKFLSIYYSDLPIESSIYIHQDIIWMADDYIILSPETYYYYTKWLESVSNLLKELK
jgi:hypothetical protein